jgi:hypothetical protein
MEEGGAGGWCYGGGGEPTANGGGEGLHEHQQVHTHPWDHSARPETTHSALATSDGGMEVNAMAVLGVRAQA